MQLDYFPVIKDGHHAHTLAQQHQDHFYLAAFALQTWIGDLLIEDITEYANHPDPATRSMQTGQAWRAFQSLFDRVPDQVLDQLIYWLLRYGQYENDLSTQLRRALDAVFNEHKFSGGFLGPEVLDPAQLSSQSALLLRRFLAGVGDWLDAVVQLHAHTLWFLQPACFDPDPEKRRLASDDFLAPTIAEMNEPAVVLPYVRPRSTTPGTPSQPPAPGQLLLKPRPWPHPALDQAIITLWPLLKLHNWTDADLWNVLSAGGIDLSPCRGPRRLGHYCPRTLGLRKPDPRGTTGTSLPPGHELAVLMLRRHAQRTSPPLGSGPWS